MSTVAQSTQCSLAHLAESALIALFGAEASRMADLPQLYNDPRNRRGDEVSTDTVQRALRRHPFIRPIGRGRGLPLTLDDYNALVEAMWQPGPGYISCGPGLNPQGTRDRITLKQLRRRRTGELARSIRRNTGLEK